MHNMHDIFDTAAIAMKNLRELDLSHNHISTLQDVDLTFFVRLEIINMNNNKLTDIGNMQDCKCLQSISLENNELREIPAEIAGIVCPSVLLCYSLLSPALISSARFYSPLFCSALFFALFFPHLQFFPFTMSAVPFMFFLIYFILLS